MCLFLRILGHPRQIADVFGQRFLQRVHHFQHALLAFRAEGQFNIALSQRFADPVINCIDTTFPARLDLWLSAECLLHFEVCVNERIRKPRSSSIQKMPADVRLPGIQRFRVKQRVHLLKEFRIADIQFRELRCAHLRNTVSADVFACSGDCPASVNTWVAYSR